MLENEISRRRMFQIGLGAAATAGLVSTTGSALGQTSAPTPSNLGLPGNPKALQESVNGAYAFLTQMMDAYAQGSTVRLSQSYADQIAGGTFFSTAFIYDNALLTCAWLARGNISRAMIVGDALLEAQNTDPAADGRFRQAYMAGLPDTNGAFVTTGLSFFQGSAVGDVAWAGIALAQLFARTRIKKYLDGALRAAAFIETTTRDNTNVPPGGYFFGNGQSNKSTEHNIDVYALFTMLAKLSGDSSWLDGAAHAKAFVEAMFDQPSGHFWTGTGDPTHIFFNNSPEDVQTWSYLAFQDPNFAVTLDWVKTNLATTDTTFAFNNGWGVFGSLRLRVSGVTYASLSKLGVALGDPSVDADAVWLEGTSHLIAALLLRRLPAQNDIPSFHGDIALASSLLESVQVAQNSLGANQTVNGQALPIGQGITAATSILNTGFNFNFFPVRHIGATSWYVMAAQGANPLQILNPLA